MITDPEGVTHDLAVLNKGTRGAVEFASTRRPGLYVLDGPGSHRIHFVVNTDRKESELEQLPLPKIHDVAKGMNASVVSSWAEYRSLDQQRRYGQEVWQFLLAALVALVFLELFLEQLFARRKR